MKLFLFPFCSFNRCLISSLQGWEGEKISFEIWTQTKNFPLSHCAGCKDFMNKIFCDIHDKITYIPVSIGVNSLSAWTCVSISLGCLPVLKIICTDKTGEDSGEKHLRQWFVHTALTITSAAMSSLIFFFFLHSFLCFWLLKVHFTERRAFLLLLPLDYLDCLHTCTKDTPESLTQVVVPGQ